MFDYRMHDLVYHKTPSGLQYIGIVVDLFPDQGRVNVKWWMEGKYFLDSPADVTRITNIGQMPEGVVWDVPDFSAR